MNMNVAETKTVPLFHVGGLKLNGFEKWDLLGNDMRKCLTLLGSLVEIIRESSWNIDWCEFYFFFQTELRSCTACGDPIADRYLLEVGGCTWHGSCLRCCVCHSPLDRQPSCFLRERQVYCKADYAKWVGLPDVMQCEVQQLKLNFNYAKVSENIFFRCCPKCTKNKKKENSLMKFCAFGASLIREKKK